ncbi:MAG TPA: alpha/beta fold hydrolase [Solirubrobacteraceae bacterium]
MPSAVTIPSGGEQLAGYLYRPEGEGDAPCVVMAHGFSATRDDGLPPYAEAFQAAGLAVVLFDYRHLGASSGEPRQLIDVRKQHDDYRAAVAFARALDGVDPDRIALWGTSFSGGHVVSVAASDPRIAAVVAQCPFTDGIPVLLNVPPRNILRGTLTGLRDQVGALAGRKPVLMPAVNPPGGFAAMTAPEAAPGFAGLVGDGSLWRNAFAARQMLTLPLYRPVAKVGRLQMPLLVCVCDGDETTLPKPAVKLGERAPRGEIKHYPHGHFDIYHDEAARQDQVEFLTRHLLRVPAVTANT